MSDWDSARVCDVCEQVPVGTKYSKELVQDHGNIKVIDQSQADIFGWHNNSADIHASHESPVFTFANHTCSMRWMEEPFSVIQNVFPIRGIPGKTDTRFLYYACGASVTQDGYKGHFPQFRESIIQLPPLPEQKKIAEILSGIDLVSGKTTAQISKLENLRVALICKFLSEGARQAEMPSGGGGNLQVNCEWKMLPVSAIADFISGYAFSSPDFIDTGTLCIRMGNLYQNKFQENRSSVFLPSEYLTKYPRFQVEAGDLLMSMTGTAGKRDYGFVVEVPDGTPKGLLNQRVGKIIPKTNYSKGYIKEVMRSPFYLEQLYEYGSGTKQANLTTGQIMGITVPVPNLPTQSRIAELLSSIRIKIDSLAVQSRKQIELASSIHKDLLSGRKRVSI